MAAEAAGSLRDRSRQPGPGERRGRPGDGAQLAVAAYGIVAALLVVFQLVVLARRQWVSDSWIHLGTIAEVVARPLDPREPLTGEAVNFPYYSPWAMVLGWTARLTSVGPGVVLAVAGTISTVLFLLALYALVRRLTRHAWAPVIALLTLLLVHGTQQFFWSGFVSLNTFSVGSTWPWVPATAGWFWLWRCTLPPLPPHPSPGSAEPAPEVTTTVSTTASTTPRRRTRIPWVFLVLPGLVLLVHPFTFAIAALSCAVTALAARPLSWTWRVGLLSLVSVCLTVLWPWQALSGLLGDPAGFDGYHAFFYRATMAKVGLCLLAVPALVTRSVRLRGRDPLTWCFVAGWVVFGAGWAIGLESLARVLPLSEVSAALALAVTLTARQRVLRYGLRLVTVAALVAGSLGQLSALTRLVTTEDGAPPARMLVAPYPRLDVLWRHARPDDVVISNNPIVAREFSSHRLRAVAPQWPSPGVADAATRIADQRAMLARGTTAARRAALFDRYDVRWIVWRGRTVPAWLADSTNVVERGRDDTILLRVDRPAT